MCAAEDLACGLNPHAGENGHLGMEELTTIIPTFEKLRQEGMDIEGVPSRLTLFSTTIILNERMLS